MSDRSKSTFTTQYLERAEQLFKLPGIQYGWDAIVEGVDVRRQNGSSTKMAAVAKNTFRGFHRISKSLPGAGEPFQQYFTKNRRRLTDELFKVKDRESLHRLSNQICTDVREGLANIKPEQLISFNKVRKPVDLYLEHLVAMSFELEEVRHVLTPLLFLPLDCQILENIELFTDQELTLHSLRRSSTYSEVMTEHCYLSLQEIVTHRTSEVATSLQGNFWPIYFDLIWNGRHSSWGRNLFESNP